MQQQILALKSKNPICKCFKRVKPKNVDFSCRLKCISGQKLWYVLCQQIFEIQLLAWSAM